MFDHPALGTQPVRTGSILRIIFGTMPELLILCPKFQSGKPVPFLIQLLLSLPVLLFCFVNLSFFFH
jgi:hypothetical protein